jgi:organic hydroperoxide reductase OsmC/OhrA
VRSHSYEVTTEWTGNTGSGTSGYRDYSRSLETTTLGRGRLPGSSDPAFRGDPTRWNPELLLLTALGQCHLLSYLHVCVEAGVVVTAYRDTAAATMVEDGAGGGRFTGAVLRPHVTVADASMVARRQKQVRLAAAHKTDEAAVRAPDRQAEVVAAARARARAAGLDADVAEQVWRAMVAGFVDLELRVHADGREPSEAP